MRPRLLILPLTLVAAGTFGLAACSSPAPTAAPGSGASSSAPAGASSSASASASAGGRACTDVSAPPAKSAEVSEPTGSLDTAKTYLVTLKTSCGDITITLDQAKNPKTANSFAHLTKEGYYNETIFHRVVPGFVIQGGDPAGNGTGGPSWKVVEAPAAGTAYTKGVVAMAKAGDEAAGTSGSQFFIVTADDAGLGPDYAVAGAVTSGQDVVDRISALGSEGSDGPPSKPVVVTSAELTEK